MIMPTKTIAFLSKATGEIEQIQPENKKNFTLKELYSLIGCDMIQVIYTPNDEFICICDEEGLYNQPVILNRAASAFANNQLVGNVVVCHTKMLK